MSDEEIMALLAEAIPTGNEWWTPEDQAEMLLPVVRRILADHFRLDLGRLSSQIVTPDELRAR